MGLGLFQCRKMTITSILGDVEHLDQQVEVLLQGLVVPVPRFHGAEDWPYQVVQEGLRPILDPV
jgi:hypothetical protein